MEAVEERKRNQDTRKFSKQVHAHRVQEKAKQKREHNKAIEQWKKGLVLSPFLFI